MTNEERIAKLEDEVAALRFLISLLTESDTTKTKLIIKMSKALEDHTEILGKIADILVR